MVLTWVVVGALLGWVANLAIFMVDRQGRVLNIGIGVAGAVCGGALVATVGDVWAARLDFFSVSAVLGALIGAAILLVLARLARVTG
jgi:uncharacterized membrane protein YeaQ/YmgE (transglycosylase-associated protein family)